LATLYLSAIAVQVLSGRVLSHWNASLVDVATARNATRNWAKNALTAAQVSLRQLEEHLSAQLVAWERYVESVGRRVERAVVPMLVAAKELWEVVAERMRYVQRAVTGTLTSLLVKSMNLSDFFQITFFKKNIFLILFS